MARRPDEGTSDRPADDQDPAGRLRAGSWLEGPGGGVAPVQDFPGQRLGLPAAGPGSVAPQGRRLLQLALDLGLSALLGLGAGALLGLSQSSELSRNAGLVALLVQTVVLTVLTGQSLGMRLCGLRVVDTYDGRPPGWLRSAARVLLLVLVIPAVVQDSDKRGLHDHAGGVVVVRA